jgi:metallophosphoesterase (TIGR00282 family)
VKLLFVGDVVASPGRKTLAALLPSLRERTACDLCIVNGENAAHGLGITPRILDQLRAAGAEVITGGNHIFDKKEGLALLESEPDLLRPHNYPGDAPGRGVLVVERTPVPVAILNLQGRVFMDPIDCPFRAARTLVGELRERTPVILVDFHAEATSEKIAMGWHLDGKVSAVVGTHTHVATADERVLPGGTAYITDVGMTGSHAGVLGVDRDRVLQRFLLKTPVQFTYPDGDRRLCGVLIDIDESTGRARAIERIEEHAAGDDETT